MTAMISNNVAMAADAGANVASQDVQNKLTALGGSKNLSPEAKAKKLREACEGFESIFIQKMWQEMRKTVPQNGMMHGKEEHYWQDMYDQELAKKMTSAGGIGLADMMYEQLSRNLVSASRGTASAMAQQQRAFVPEAAPMMPATATAENTDGEAARADAALKPQMRAPNINATKAPVMAAASIYDGAAPVQDHGPAPETAKAAKAEAAENRVAPAVDPALDNPAVSQALASLKQEQHRRNQNGTAPMAPAAAAQAATVTPEQAFAAAAQPHHEMSPIERAQMVRRDIGDQLGSRGVRNPIKPQTAKAKARTEGARAQREAKRSFEKQPELARANTAEVTPRNSRAGAGIAAYHAQQNAANGVAPIAPLTTTAPLTPAAPAAPASPAAPVTPVAQNEAPVIAPLTVGTAPKLDGTQAQISGIPPLTASDMRI